MKFHLEAVLAACLLCFSVATEDDRKLQDGTLVDLAVGDPELSTLVAAVMAAGLVDVLSGAGPFTLFAPINDAFLPPAIDEAYLNLLLTPEFNLHLQNLLAYHVTEGEVLSTALSNGQVVEMVNGETLTVEIDDTGVFLTNPLTTEAQVIEPDLIASNGVAHKIGGSILFPSFVGRDLVDLLSSDPNYSTLVSLIQMAGLTETLRSAEALTVLAPDNTAFGSLPQDILDSLTADSDALQAVLLYHVIEGVAASTSLTSGQVPTLNGESLQVVVSDGGITFDGVPVVQPDGLARNGIAHGISSVLIPGGDSGPVPPPTGGPPPPPTPGGSPSPSPVPSPPTGGPPPPPGMCDGIVVGGFGS